MKEKRLK